MLFLLNLFLMLNKIKGINLGKLNVKSKTKPLKNGFILLISIIDL